MPDAASPAVHVRLAALRERGALRVDPVRFGLIAALAQRAQAHQGAIRRVLDERLATLLVVCEKRCEERAEQGAEQAETAARASASPLAELVQRLAQHAANTGQDPAAGEGVLTAVHTAPPTELKALRQSRSTWTQLSVDHQLARSVAKRPENAGPLNSHLLALRSLEAMRDLSPDYLRRFMSSFDALWWLDQAGSGGLPLPRSLAPADSPKKPKRAGKRKAG